MSSEEESITYADLIFIIKIKWVVCFLLKTEGCFNAFFKM